MPGDVAVLLAETNPQTGQPFFSAWVWVLTIVGVLALMALDLFVVDSKPHVVGNKEAVRWVVFYISLAAIFGLGLWLFVDGRHSLEFFTGYALEYALSIDNLFVFVLIMGAFAVPKVHQHRVLLIGILIALVMRGGFIALGAAVLQRYQWVFFIFGAFLLFTAWKLAFDEDDEDEYSESKLVRYIRKVYPVTEDYHGSKSFVRIDGRRWLTPMFVVIVAIGTTDLMFALDSIPAIFGVTTEPYIVFTANAFALMGLRQLFFLIGGLLDKLVYLPKGLAVVLAFIGLKMVLEALAAVGVHGVPHLHPVVSLAVIIVILVVTAILSLRKSRRDELAANTEAGDAATSYDPRDPA